MDADNIYHSQTKYLMATYTNYLIFEPKHRKARLFKMVIFGFIETCLLSNLRDIEYERR